MKNPPFNAWQLPEIENSIMHSISPVDGNPRSSSDLNPAQASITEGYFTVDDQWIINSWNAEIVNISGVSCDEAIGTGLWNYFSNQGNLKLYSECRRAKKENVSVRFEAYYPLLSAWLETYVYPTESGLAVFVKNITSFKLAEQHLKLTNERFEYAAKATNDLIWDWDIISGEIYRNEDAVKLVYGQPGNDPIRTNTLWLEYIHPDDKKKIDEQVGYYIGSEGETSFVFEYRFRRADGGYNYINDRGYLIRNELGIVTRMIGAARDITAQRRIVQNIQESELRYKSFISQSLEGIWRVELRQPIPVNQPLKKMMAQCMEHAYLAECNNAFAIKCGYESAEIITGIPLGKLMPLENPVNYEYLEKFFRNQFKVEDELSFETDSSGNQHIFVNNMLGSVEEGCLVRAWGTQREITVQKKAEKLLLASEEQYRNLFNNNPCTIIIWSLDELTIEDVNHTAIELYGYSQEEFRKLTILDIRPEDEHEEFLEMLDFLRANDNYRKTKTWRHITKDGSKLYMEISSQHLFYNGKKCLLAIGNNITDKVQLENRLVKERQQIQKQVTDAVITGQERERSKLGQELHDNINQILASTKLYIECAMADVNKRGDLLERSKLQLDTAMEEIRKLSKTLAPPSLGENSLTQAIDDLLRDMPSLETMSIRKNWKNLKEDDLCEKLKLTIYRIIQEQLNNIHRHARASEISISITKDKNLLVLDITDNGVGFDPAVKRNGIGLKNISSRAELINGTAEIISSPGEGCNLCVQFKL